VNGYIFSGFPFKFTNQAIVKVPFTRKKFRNTIVPLQTGQEGTGSSSVFILIKDSINEMTNAAMFWFSVNWNFHPSELVGLEKTTTI
jgi:hypothetical protein